MKSARNDVEVPTSRLLIAIALLWLPCVGANADSSSGAQAPIDKIRALIGDAACDGDAQCRTIAIGTKSCGGPEYYLAWSTKRTDAAALLDAVAAHAGARRPEALRPGVHSNCVLVTDPGAYCAPDGVLARPDQAQKQGSACRLRSSRQDGRGPVD